MRQIFTNIAQIIRGRGASALLSDIQIMDVYGRVVQQKFGDKPEATIEVGNLNAGMYYVSINAGTESQVIKFIKQ